MKSNSSKFLKKTYILFLLLIIYLPLLFMVVLSFVNPSPKGNISIDASNGWGGGSYAQLVSDDFLNALFNTLIVLIISAPISVLIATLTCYSIWNNRVSIIKTTQTITRINVINPEVITGICLTLLFSTTWIAIGFNFGFFTLILSHISFCTPYAIIVIYPRMAKFNKNLQDASKDLGYNSFQTFIRVVVPYLMPSILGALAITSVMSFDDFIITNLVRGRVVTISSEIYLMAKGIKSWVLALGTILLLILITFVLIKTAISFKNEKEQTKQIIFKNYKRKWESNEKLKKSI